MDGCALRIFENYIDKIIRIIWIIILQAPPSLNPQPQPQILPPISKFYSHIKLPIKLILHPPSSPTSSILHNSRCNQQRFPAVFKHQSLMLNKILEFPQAQIKCQLLSIAVHINHNQSFLPPLMLARQIALFHHHSPIISPNNNKSPNNKYSTSTNNTSCNQISIFFHKSNTIMVIHSDLEIWPLLFASSKKKSQTKKWWPLLSVSAAI